jgi:thiamine transport system permease protein
MVIPYQNLVYLGKNPMFSFNCINYTILMSALLQALVSTIISVFFGLILAYFFDRFSFKLKSFFLAIAPLLCIMPSKLTALGIQLGLKGSGIWAIIFGHCALNIPFAFYIFYGTYQNYNSHWRLIAKEYGASSWQSYKDIDLIFLYPTIISTSSIIFLLCFTSFSLPLVLGTEGWHMTPDILISQLYTQGNYDHALYYFIMRLMVILPLCCAIKKETVRWFNTNPKIYEKFYLRFHGVMWPIVLTCISIIVLGPLLCVLWYSVDSKVLLFLYAVAAGSIDIVLSVPLYRVIYNSILLAMVSSVGAVLLGYMCAKALEYDGIILRRVILLCSSALFILGSVGCGILFSMIAHCTLLSRFFIVAVCHAILNYPFAYRLIQAHFHSWQSEWDLSAQSFGASIIDRLFTLGFPYLKKAFAQAFCISFGLSLTEVGAGSILHDATGITIPMAIKMYREQGCMEGVIGLSIILLGIVFIFAYVVHSRIAHINTDAQ